MENRKRVIALGFFDGVHTAHAALLRRAAERAEQLNAVPAAITFDRFPKTMQRGGPVPLINTPADRTFLMEKYCGIREVVVLEFDRALMELPWDAFVTDLLVEQFGCIHVVAGHDYRFGYKGEGNPEKLKALCTELGIGCDIIDKVELDGITVSSTHIRSLIEAGEMEEAHRFLGHPHVLSGPVVGGQQLGRTIGVPTANLIVPEGVVVPAYGVYATRVIMGQGIYLAVTNVGVRPTVDDGRGVTVEPWILDFEGDLYGQNIHLEFYKQLRGERKFASLAELKEEICRNAEQTRAYFKRG